jgi:hypothetical protein
LISLALYISLHYISFSILTFSSGIVLFEEWNDETLYQQIFSSTSISLILFGIYVLSIFYSKDENLIPKIVKKSIGHMKLANFDFDDEDEEEEMEGIKKSEIEDLEDLSDVLDSSINVEVSKEKDLIENKSNEIDSLNAD